MSSVHIKSGKGSFFDFFMLYKQDMVQCYLLSWWKNFLIEYLLYFVLQIVLFWYIIG